MPSAAEKQEQRWRHKIKYASTPTPRKFSDSERCYSCNQKALEKIKRMQTRDDGSFYEVELNYCGSC